MAFRITESLKHEPYIYLSFLIIHTILYYSRYGLSNCLFAATYDEILRKCACVPFFHTLAWDDFPKICAGTALKCMNEILNNIGNHTSVEDINGVKKLCYSPCIDQVRFY